MKIFTLKTKEKYYSSKDIDKTEAVYRIIVGQRSNGKTYCLIKKAIEEFFKTGKPSAYIRRYAEDIMPKNLSHLIDPHQKLIEKLSKGNYNNCTYRNNQFNFCYIDKEGKTLRKSDVPFLYTTALSNWERTKGADRGEVGYIIFDEFMTRGRYLNNEFVTFTNVLSSFIRNREGTIIYMIGNTVNKYSPYIAEMGLDKVESQKQGSICVYTYNNDKLTVAVEYCLESEATKDVEYYYAFDNSQLDMIKTGSWEEDSYPHLTDFSIHKEDIKFRFLVRFTFHEIIGEIIKRDQKLFLYFHPLGNSNYTWTAKDVVYTDEPTNNYMWSDTFENNTTKAHSLIKDLFYNRKCYYSSNSVGEVIRNFNNYIL